MHIQRILRLQNLCTSFRRQINGNSVRTYLTAGSYCEDAWKSRFAENLIKDVNPLETSYKLLENEAKSKIIYAIDFDIFVHSISDENLDGVLINLLDVMQKFRKCPQSCEALPSTNHAILRLLRISPKKALELLSDPRLYGLFLDAHMAKIFMNEALKLKQYEYAASFATHLMLQEDFESPINSGLAIFSCVKYLFSEEKESLIKMEPDNISDSEDEEPKIEYFDEHFDLEDPNHVIGKTLIYAAINIDDDYIKHNATVLGLSLYEKFEEMKVELKEAKIKNISLAADVSSLLEQQLEKCEKEEEVTVLKEYLESAAKDSDKEASTFPDTLEKYVKKVISENESKEIEDQHKMYAKWALERIEVHKKIQKHFNDEAKKLKISQYKDELQKEEDYLHFFDNENKWLARADTRRSEKEDVEALLKRVTFKKKKDIEYVLPEMNDRSSLVSAATTKKKITKGVKRRYVKYRDVQDLLDVKTRRHCGFFLYGNWKTI